MNRFAAMCRLVTRNPAHPRAAEVDSPACRADLEASCRSVAGAGMKIVPMSLVLAGLMALATAAGIAARPSQKADATGPVFSLEQTIPKQFGDWRELEQESADVVNP